VKPHKQSQKIKSIAKAMPVDQFSDTSSKIGGNFYHLTSSKRSLKKKSAALYFCCLPFSTGI
jgi:hypothetical protein